MKGPLAGLKVLVTRPAHQADALCRLIEAAGGAARRLPLLAIEPVGEDAALSEHIESLKSGDAWLFTSRNAVVRVAALAAGDWPTCYSIGPATARALADAGHEGSITAEEGASSAALLARHELQAVSGRRFAIFTGEGGLDRLAEGLRERGASVERVEVYRRVAVDHPSARVEAEIAIADAIVVGSGETLIRLWRTTPEALRPMLRRRRLVVPSRRVVEQAKALGFVAPLVPETVSDEAWVRCLVAWRETAADSDMNDLPPNSADPPAALETGPEAGLDAAAPGGGRPASGNGGALLAWVLVAILCTALLAGAAWFWQRDTEETRHQADQDRALEELARQVAELHAQSGQLASRQGDLSRSLQRNGVELSALQARADESADVMGRISEELQGGRIRFQLVSVEQLLTLANDRLLLERDVTAAIAALELAEQRLAAINEPRLFPVRQALADERAALQELPGRGHSTIALQLASLIDRAGAFPLLLERPDRRAVASTEAARDALSDAPPSAWRRFRTSLEHALDALFTVRRTDRPEDLRLLPAEHASAMRQSLALKLEASRVALLRDDTAMFRSATRSAAALLRERFDVSAPSVVAALADLEKWQALELAPPLPAIDRGLILLRAQIEAPPR